MNTAVMKLDAWFETMRGEAGYGGPVAHWWRNCLHFTGAGLDWRYEGIILGYLHLYERTGAEKWLQKARRAGDDLVNGQLADGTFSNSSFELNPYAGGTPHESGCDLALLTLAQVLRVWGAADWHCYAEAAERNLNEYYIRHLWDGGIFWDSATTIVPNKLANLAEALLKWAEVREEALYAEHYALPALEYVLRQQIREPGRLHGAFIQYSTPRQQMAWFFPYYVARCASGLLAGYRWTEEEKYLVAVGDALAFILRQGVPLPQVVYPRGRMNRYPAWFAGVGDVLRVVDEFNALAEAELRADALYEWLLSGQDASGGIRTAHGFAAQVTQRKPGDLPEFRDVLPVCGWCDKAFRYLAAALPAGVVLPESVETAPVQLPCFFRGKRMIYEEDAHTMRLTWKGQTVYLWEKGQDWAQTSLPQLLFK